MASAGQPAATEPAASKVPKGKKELKILMLHGTCFRERGFSYKEFTSRIPY